MKHRGLPERTARQILLLVIAACCLLHFVFVSAFATPPLPAERRHFDGVKYFNPDTGPEGRPSTGRFLRWVGRWLFGADWTPWPDPVTLPPVTTAKPPKRVREGIVITVVGHATFLIQMDGLNLLMDPMWSDRCSPLSWIGPRRHQPPGIRLEDLPPLDGILITHNHYDHLDLPTLRHLALHRPARVLVPLGNGALIRTAGLRDVQELDWWDKVRFSPTVEVTLV
ncbi:MAG: MBL fold metallo-hydrolase, partial [Syntrophales bacterium]|nr:MBL fold metallo-hydrolase [Syntrophales bacterium]